MAVKLDREVIELFEDTDTVKVLATTDADGVPHAVIKQCLKVIGDGNIQLLELLESSQNNRNLVRSIWFDKTVAVSLRGKNGKSFVIKGKAIKSIVSGPEFQKHYVGVRERHADGDADLAAVWVIEPQEVIDETYGVRKAHEEATRPYFKHLDRLAKPDNAPR